jgi:predicted HD superfamily hydrolase involved in NAD metabolism
MEKIKMKDIEYIKKDLKESIGNKLYNHCVNVMNTAVDLAVHYKVDVEKARISGLLHDCGKLYNKNIGNLEHADLGAEIAKGKYDVEDNEIINAILYHTTGRENMTMLEKIVYIADKIEPNRSYDRVDEIREMAYSNIDKAIMKSFESTFGYLRAKKVHIDKKSLDSYEFLKNTTL